MMAIASPCISVCRMSTDLALACGDMQAASGQGLCEGCLRSIDEIVTWGSLPDSARQSVYALLVQRAERCGRSVPTLTASAVPAHVSR